MSSTNRNNTLTSAEIEQLSKLEAIVRRGLETDLELGNALAEISDALLYRATHQTFEAYLRDRWDIRRPPENQLSQAAEPADPPCSDLRHEQPAELQPEPRPTLGPPGDLDASELLPRLGSLLTRSGGTIADVVHHLETRAADVDDAAREKLRGDILALYEELATLDALLEPVDWDAEHGRLLAGEIPPFQDDADDETDD